MKDKNINNLISKLSEDSALKPVFSVNRQFAKWIIYTIIYLTGISFYFGIRSDLSIKLAETHYFIEITCLVLLILTSLYSSLNLALPDHSQKKSVLILPTISIILFVAVLVYLCINYTENLPIDHKQGMICIGCITFSAIIPTFFLFLEVRKAATTKPNLLSFYVLTYATSLSALALRLEPSDPSIYQTILYHYVPIIIFAIIAYLLPKRFLKW
ncbi:MAG TPA: hypothetical protein DIV86_02795 [Alphaproteobacteria bacterium]|nr:hypothetical protein [Alphaproteobacteria bacterium]